MSTPELYEKMYDELYDDHDKYFDYIYELREDIHNFIKDKSLLILDRERFPDFFDFCTQLINRPLLDAEIKEQHIRKLNQELKETGFSSGSSVYERDNYGYGYEENLEKNLEENLEENLPIEELDEVVIEVIPGITI